jgi:hypothetical protein
LSHEEKRHNIWCFHAFSGQEDLSVICEQRPRFSLIDRRFDCSLLLVLGRGILYIKGDDKEFLGFRSRERRRTDGKEEDSDDCWRFCGRL